MLLFAAAAAPHTPGELPYDTPNPPTHAYGSAVSGSVVSVSGAVVTLGEAVVVDANLPV